MIDIAALLEDSETKTEALEKAAELEDELSQVSNKREIDNVSSCILRQYDRHSCSPRRLRNQNWGIRESCWTGRWVISGE